MTAEAESQPQGDGSGYSVVAQISYTVKELLAIQNESLNRIERKVDEGALRQAESIAKIDTRVTLLEARPDLEPRVDALEQTRDHLRGEHDFKRYLWPTLATIAIAVATVVPIFHLP